MGEFSFEAYRKTKAYKASMKRFQNRLYFNKKFREDFLKSIDESRNKFAEVIEKSPQPLTFEEARWSSFNEQMLDKLGGFQDVNSRVAKFFKDDAVTDGKFRLYKKGSEAVFTNTYRKGGKRKLRKAYLYLKEGIPVKTRKRGVMVREADFPLAGFSEADNGEMTQTRRSFEKTILKYIGKNKYKFLIYVRGRNPENLWVERAKR